MIDTKIFCCNFCVIDIVFFYLQAFEKWLLLNEKEEEHIVFHEKITFKHFKEHLDRIEQMFSEPKITTFKNYIINRLSDNGRMSEDSSPFRDHAEIVLTQVNF